MKNTYINILVMILVLISVNINAQISRSQVVANGEAYEQQQWTATSNNIKTNYNCGNKLISTPTWVQVGSNRSLPYCWGGNTALSAFQARMNEGKVAGDTKTISSGYNYGAEDAGCSAGVDCSGFVSRSFGLSTHYSTYSLPNISSTTTWNALQRGDFVNSTGHTRLVHTVNSNGLITTLEASTAPNHKVHYANYTTANLGNYTPRTYNSITNNPSITVSYPNSSSTWIKGRNYIIQWADDISNNVVVRLYKGSSYIASISTSTASDGYFNYNVPTWLANGTDYRIRIYSNANASISDYSGYFTITEDDCIDNFESNNSANQAAYVGSGNSYTLNNLCLTSGDNDYFRFEANGQNYYVKVRGFSGASTGKYKLLYTRSGNTFTIETQSYYGSSVDTYLYLYSSNGTTALASDDDSGAGLFSKITYTIPTSGGGYCYTPGYAATSNVTSTYCYLYWGAVSGANYYSLWYWNGSGPVWFNNATSNGLYVGLSPGSNFWLGVKSECGGTSSSIKWTYVTTPSYLVTSSNGDSNDQISSRGEEIEVSIPEGAAITGEMNTRVYPNPFRDKSTIEFTLLEDSEVTVFITDMMGKKVAVLADNKRETAGIHQLIFEGNDLSAGVYYCTIIAGEYKSVQKIVLTK